MTHETSIPTPRDDVFLRQAYYAIGIIRWAIDDGHTQSEGERAIRRLGAAIATLERSLTGND